MLHYKGIIFMNPATVFHGPEISGLRRTASSYRVYTYIKWNTDDTDRTDT